MKNKLFIFLIASSAIFIAGCAAFFSVTGLGLLFAGATIPVIIMASSLEIGKIVSALYLHRMWSYTRRVIRAYMLVSILILMVITSGGIFGFLSNAYEQMSISRGLVDNKIILLENRKESYSADIPRWQNRIIVLTKQRTSQETRYDSLSANEHWVNAGRTYKLIVSADLEIKELNARININRDSVNLINNQIYNTSIENVDKEREIGGFRFIARSLNQPIDNIVKWFIILLIFVFDPLAISLILAWQTLLTTSNKEQVSVQKQPKKDIKKYKNSPIKYMDHPEDEVKDLTDSEKEWNTLGLGNQHSGLEKKREKQETSKKIEGQNLGAKKIKTKKDGVTSGTNPEDQKIMDDIYDEKKPWMHYLFDWSKEKNWKGNKEAEEYYLKYVA